jgi:hypothetical protein
MRCTQEPAGLTPGRPDEGVWAYASGHTWASEPTWSLRGQIYSRGDGVNLQLKLEELGEETSNFKRAELTRRFLQQNSCQERRAGTQQPLNAPYLHCLPIQSSLNGENQADANGSGHADQSEDERHQRRRRKT